MRLVPILVHTPYSGWSLSLKIGRSHLYVVKNVDTLLGAFEFGKTLTYGKDLTFEHDRAALSPSMTHLWISSRPSRNRRTPAAAPTGAGI